MLKIKSICLYRSYLRLILLIFGKRNQDDGVWIGSAFWSQYHFGSGQLPDVKYPFIFCKLKTEFVFRLINPIIRLQSLFITYVFYPVEICVTCFMKNDQLFVPETQWCVIIFAQQELIHQPYFGRIVVQKDIAVYFLHGTS